MYNKLHKSRDLIEAAKGVAPTGAENHGPSVATKLSPLRGFELLLYAYGTKGTYHPDLAAQTLNCCFTLVEPR